MWSFAPEALTGERSVHLADWPELDVPSGEADDLRAAYETVSSVREVVMKALEDARNDKRIGKSQEASVAITADPETLAVLRARGEEALAELFIVASVVLSEGAETAVVVGPASGEKCPRCWNYRDLGVDPAHADVCERCARVLAGAER